MSFTSELKKYANGVTAATTGAVVAAAAVGTALTDPENRWYKSLRKPSWQPPAAVFPVAWTALYADIAAVNSMVLTDLVDTGQREQAKGHATALGVNLALNAGWCGLFFRSKRTWLAAAGAGALALSSADLTRRAYESSPARGVALAPYAGWTAFATALSTAIAAKN